MEAPVPSVEFSVLELLRWQEAGFGLSATKSEFYGGLFRRFIDDCEHGSTTLGALIARAPMTLTAAAPLRLMGGLHRGVLTGEFAELAAAWPAPDGTNPGDVDRAYDQIQLLVADPSASLLDALTRDPQTNEVGRAAALAAGLAQIASEVVLPIRLFEIGASAGLNLRLDRYAYAAGGHSWGDPHSMLRFDGRDFIGVPPFDAAPVIVERRGCDIHPIDASSDDGATTLLSYVWPDQTARIARLRAALTAARTVPVTIDQASADEWVIEHVLARPGTTTVLMHSVMWQYMPAAVQQSVSNVMHERGTTATAAAPIAWLQLEPTPATVEMELALTVWPGGHRRVLGTSGAHGAPVRWTG